jgi:hypothetical protein
MNPIDPRLLLGGYATGTLTKSERDALMQAVLEDPELFEEFVEEEDWRGALEGPAFRQRLIRRLRQLEAETKPSWRQRVAGSLERMWRPRWALTAVGLAAAILVVVLIRQGAIEETSPVARIVLGPGSIPALHAAGILEEPGGAERELEKRSRTEPPPPATGAWLVLDRAGRNPGYRVGDRLRVGFQVPAAGNVVLVEERPDGSTVRLFPNRFQSSATVVAGATILVPPSGQGDLEVAGPPGQRTLRLLLFPSAVNPLAADADWAQARAHARVLERRYEVNE